MKIFKFIFLISAFFIFSACEDLSFNDEDFISPKIKSVQEIIVSETKNREEIKEVPPVVEEDKQIAKEREKISEEEITILSEDLELSENTIIQNKKVILDMMTIQTLQHDLTIIAEEFVSNHFFIRNFPEGQTAQKKENGRSGGHVLIKARTAKGSLLLTLSGENGSSVPKREITRRERAKLSGRNGENGYNAVYDTWCRDFYIPLGLGFFGKIVLDRNCWNECRVHPTRGQNGGNGRQGYPGYDGRKGGNSGSFYLQASNLSDFHLTDVQKTPGLGSPGGKGSSGGYGGKRGKNGRDTENLCSSHLPRPKKGRKGNRGKYGKDGENGREGEVCLESLKNQNQQTKENTQTEKESSAINKNQSENKKIEIKCKKDESGIMCREVLLENQSAEILDNKNQRENVVCY